MPTTFLKQFTNKTKKEQTKNLFLLLLSYVRCFVVRSASRSPFCCEVVLAVCCFVARSNGRVFVKFITITLRPALVVPQSRETKCLVHRMRPLQGSKCQW